jgi:GNAT superfamily N-acetyltransferase
MIDNILIQTAVKSDKKSIKKYYKQQQYSASFMGLDTVFVIRYEGEIIASVIISLLKKQYTQYFLHALVVDKKYRKQGLATKLLNYCNTNGLDIICFAVDSMSGLYLGAGYTRSCQNKLNETNLLRFHQYQKSKPTLQVFIKQQ